MPNSHRNIEPELMRRLVNDRRIINLTASYYNNIGLEILNNRLSIGSISELDQFSADELYRFLNNTYNIQETVINGSEQFPGKLLRPEKFNLIISSEILDLLVEYYETSYETINFRKPFIEDIDNNSIIIQNKAKQYGRY